MENGEHCRRFVNLSEWTFSPSSEGAGMASKIRNVLQSVQKRDVTKQSPDLVCYIEGQDYLINPYLGEAPGTPVAFNNYISAFQASYDMESMVPNCSITLVVPNVHDHLFRMPGGNNLLKTMAEIRVFAKGYYLSKRNNTVFHQVFRGFITSISYAMDGKFTNIAVSASGSLGLLERMQIEVNPALQSVSPLEATAMSSTTYNMGPYDQIKFLFLFSSMLDGFNFVSLVQDGSKANILNSAYYQAVESGYVVKWQALLYDLCRDTHVFGTSSEDDENVLLALTQNRKASPASKQGQSTDNTAVRFDIAGTKSEVEVQQAGQQLGGFYDVIRQYMPEMSFGKLELFNGRIMTRLERLRTFTTLVGFEAYQDIDGGIVIKPPLYNLDVTVVTDPTATMQPPSNTLLDIYDQNNPFIVHLSEILSESETEDESQVKMTRVLVRGSLEPASQFVSAEQFLTVAEDVDIPRMAQFGLRTGPPIDAGWFKDGDTQSLFAYASTEMARANRSFRTYNLSIPMRPELKLGFPMYLPHKDMYGYVKSVSINYTRGSQATMEVSLDSLRRRPLLPETQNVTNQQGVQVSKVLLTPQINLVLEWTKPEQADQGSGGALVGSPMTIPLPNNSVHDQDWQMQHYRETKIGNSYMLPVNTKNSWRVQLDRLGIWNHPRILGPAPADAPATASNDYYMALQQFRPYTDVKGYEVIGTFPYGRWDTLKNCVNLFTIAGIPPQTDNNPATGAAFTPVSPDTVSFSSAQAFLFSGTSSPPATSEAATTLLTALKAQTASINDFKIFELTYDQTNTPSHVGGQPLTNTPSQIEPNSGQIATDFATVMVSGKAVQTNQAKSILANIPQLEP